jgi:hypothetical protein
MGYCKNLIVNHTGFLEQILPFFLSIHNSLVEKINMQIP